MLSRFAYVRAATQLEAADNPLCAQIKGLFQNVEVQNQLCNDTRNISTHVLLAGFMTRSRVESDRALRVPMAMAIHAGGKYTPQRKLF